MVSEMPPRAPESQAPTSAKTTIAPERRRSTSNGFGFRLETARIEAFSPRLFPTLPQEQIRQVARLTPEVDEEEFLLEAHPGNGEPHAPLVQDAFAREFHGLEPRFAGWTVDVWGVCEHLSKW